jgi:hypothetical protein
MTTQEKFAISVEDSGELFLFLDITKGRDGDVYVNFNPHHPTQKPHSSYHASGQRHYKSDSRMVLPKRILQSPNHQFKGVENIITTSLRRGSGRSWNVACQEHLYSKVMVIKDDIILPEFGFLLTVDLFESGFLPAGYSNSTINIIQQEIFSTKIPQIVATVFEVLTPNNDNS